MQKLILLLILLTFLSSCQPEDDLDKICSSNCTVLKGRFVTLNNTGIQDIKVSLDYRIPNAIGPGKTRLIARTETDENGFFYKEFYIKDEELGKSAKGYFKIKYDDTNLDVSKYILSDNRVGNGRTSLGQAIYSISKRDTIIGNTYYLPKKTTIKVNLKNFAPIKEGDYFEVMTLYPFGAFIGENDYIDTQYSTGSSPFEAFRATETNTSVTPFVAENEENVIRFRKRKNGINTSEEFHLFVPKNNSIELNYSY